MYNGVGRWEGVGGQKSEQLEAGYTFHKDTSSSVVSLSNKNEYTIQSIGLDGH